MDKETFVVPFITNMIFSRKLKDRLPQTVTYFNNNIRSISIRILPFNKERPKEFYQSLVSINDNVSDTSITFLFTEANVTSLYLYFHSYNNIKEMDQHLDQYLSSMLNQNLDNDFINNCYSKYYSAQIKKVNYSLIILPFLFDPAYNKDPFLHYFTYRNFIDKPRTYENTTF